MQPQQQTIDIIYQSYGKDLYRISDDSGNNNIMNSLQPNQNANNSGSVTVSADSVDSGVSASSTQQASGSASQQGKKTFDNTVPGYILGFDPKDGYAKFYIGNATTYFNWTGTAVVIQGTLQTGDTGQRIVLSSADGTMRFYDASGQIVGIGVSNAQNAAILVTPDATVATGVFCTSTVANTVGFYYLNSSNVVNRALFISQTGTTLNTTPAVEINYNGTAEALFIAPVGTGIGVQIARTSGSASNPLLKVLDSNATSATVLQIQQSSASASGSTVTISNSGSGTSLDITGSGAATKTVNITAHGGYGVYLSHDVSNNAALYITKSAAYAAIEVAQSANSVSDAIGIIMSIANSSGSSYAFNFNGSEIVTAAVGGSQDKKIKIKIGGTVYYIPCYTA